jgi:hypothetical protein
VRTDDPLGQMMVAMCEGVGVPLDQIEDITAGCVNTAHEGMGDIARTRAISRGGGFEPPTFGLCGVERRLAGAQPSRGSPERGGGLLADSAAPVWSSKL